MATPIWKKIALVLFGIFLFFVLLEAGLRLGGFMLLSIREYGNLQSIKQKGAYRILCLGESTTDRQYPQFLEQILNQRNIGVRFSVVDKGRAGINTLFILSQIKTYLAEYHPDMIVAMMGINDKGVKYYQDISETDTWLFRHCRVYRFGRILFMHILKKIRQEDIYGFNKVVPDTKNKPRNAETTAKKADLLNEMPARNVMKSDFGGNEVSSGPNSFYPNGSRISETEKSLRKSGPKNDHAYAELGRLYQDQGKLPQAEDSFKKAIELNPKNDRAYVGLGSLYREQEKFPQAEDLFKKAIELNPQNDKAYAGLGWFYRVQFKLPQAEDLFRKAIELNPQSDDAYAGLGWLYRDQGKFSQADDLFKKAIEINPKNDYLIYELGGGYRRQGEFSKAEDLFKKAIEINPKNERVLGSIVSLYEEMGKPELAKEYTEKTNRLRSAYFAPVAEDNYRKLKEILDRKGIKLVCVQYPMRNVAHLKKIFEKERGVIFVDNKGVFMEALKKAGYKEYFRDMFAGDFGHCTQKGNMLLAQNIAAVILREVFKK